MDDELSHADIEQLAALKHQYFTAVDSKDWAGLRDVFTDDVIVYASPPRPDRDEVAFRDADTFVAYLSRRLERAESKHRGSSLQLTRIDADTAAGVWEMSDRVVDRRTGRGHQGRGHYHEKYRRLPDGWRIAEIRLVYSQLEHIPGEAPASA